METQPSIQLPSFSAKLLPSSVSTTITLQGRAKEPDGARMEIDLTKDEEVPPDVKPKINFISTSSKKRSLDEWFISDDPPEAAADEGEGRNESTAVTENATITSSTKNVSSLHVPAATSTAGLHQPTSIHGRDVGKTDGLHVSATTTAQPSSSDVAPPSSRSVLASKEDHAQASSSGIVSSSMGPASTSKKEDKEEKSIIPLLGIDDSNSDSSSVVSGIEDFVDKSPDREIVDY